MAKQLAKRVKTEQCSLCGSRVPRGSCYPFNGRWLCADAAACLARFAQWWELAQLERARRRARPPGPRHAGGPA